MEKKNPNIYQRALDIVNNRINPDISQGGSSVVTKDEVDEKTEALQPKSITDSGGYFTSDTVEGALQEIGAELSGINTLLGSGEITS